MLIEITLKSVRITIKITDKSRYTPDLDTISIKQINPLLPQDSTIPSQKDSDDKDYFITIINFITENITEVTQLKHMRNVYNNKHQKFQERLEDLNGILIEYQLALNPEGNQMSLANFSYIAKATLTGIKGDLTIGRGNSVIKIIDQALKNYKGSILTPNAFEKIIISIQEKIISKKKSSENSFFKGVRREFPTIYEQIFVKLEPFFLQSKHEAIKKLAADVLIEKPILPKVLIEMVLSYTEPTPVTLDAYMQK